MKGAVLAGGLGTRLYPLTYATNKHLLPVYNKPMVFYPLEILVKAGVDEIILVTGGPHAGHFIRVLGNGKKLGIKHLEYTYQEKEGGIAEALGLCEDFADNGKIVVILGDNIFTDQEQIRQAVSDFQKQEKGAKILLKEVADPQRFGVAELQGDKIIDIEEKPAQPKSNFCVTGCYFYDFRVFDIVKALKPSGRGELEITDVNNFYVQEGTMTYAIVKGEWTDAGTFDSLLRANILAAKFSTILSDR